MIEIGLTGGIGAGKSTVAAGLVARGAVLIDADAIVRDLQSPGRPVFVAMVERWGQRVVAPDGTLDRATVAAIVFANEEELAALNAIVHPAVVTEMAKQRAEAIAAEMSRQRGAAEIAKRSGAAGIASRDDGVGATASGSAGDSADSVVVLDIPLLVRADGEPVKADYRDLAGIVVVDVDAEIAVQRLVRNRGFNENDARARISHQASRQARLAVADFVIHNNGTLDSLESQIEACWQWARSLK